ncbi:transmembrane protein 263-B [Lingula anatina]|uniref:Transmembrane protein 263-B n=1 Tax=Lingula anatina TaxID=7574 RepID=A0A1S3IHQ5_LINAN|nr:transmembrane protein 263-B [Lingula anatina]|eukprot:XP_013397019.1 transmembrane protein 263-B [Lingula anatina]
MSGWVSSVYSCIVKKPASEQVEVILDPNDVKETDAPEYSADKKTDNVEEPQQSPGMVWRLSSGVFNTATGAVGLGVGGVKWAASKGYNVGAAVVSGSQAVASKVPVVNKLPGLSKKDKSD